MKSQKSRQKSRRFELIDPEQERQEQAIAVAAVAPEAEMRDVNVVAAGFLSLVNKKADEARVIELSEADRLQAELQPLVSESKRLSETASKLLEKHSAILAHLIRIDRLVLRQYAMPESTVNALVRTAEGMDALLNSTVTQLRDVPRLINQIPASDNPRALANGVRLTVSRARDMESDVQGALTRIRLYVDDLHARLERAGAPGKVFRIITAEPRNPNAVPTIELSGPVEADFGVDTGRPVKQATGGPA